jgi:hypothetical protein
MLGGGKEWVSRVLRIGSEVLYLASNGKFVVSAIVTIVIIAL